MSERELKREDESVPFYPVHVRSEARVVAGIIVTILLIGALGLVFPVGLADPADPMDTPAHVKPEWYFLSLYQLLKFIPKTAGALLPVILLVIVTLWPFFDRKPDMSTHSLRIRAFLVAAVLFLLIALTVWGEMS